MATARLECWHGPPALGTTTLELAEGTVGMGRAQPAQLLLTDPRISSNHAAFAVSADGVVTVTDTSTNGTYLNGKLLEKGAPSVLADGDVRAAPISPRPAAPVSSRPACSHGSRAAHACAGRLTRHPGQERADARASRAALRLCDRRCLSGRHVAARARCAVHLQGRAAFQAASAAAGVGRRL